MPRTKMFNDGGKTVSSVVNSASYNKIVHYSSGKVSEWVREAIMARLREETLKRGQDTPNTTDMTPYEAAKHSYATTGKPPIGWMLINGQIKRNNKENKQ